MLAELLGRPRSAADIKASFAWAIRHRDYLKQNAPAHLNQAAAKSFRVALWGPCTQPQGLRSSREQELAEFHLMAHRRYAGAAKQKRQRGDDLAKWHGEVAWSSLLCELT